ncbi:ferric-chelate reductase Frp1 [Cryptotrichosporon argae]
MSLHPRQHGAAAESSSTSSAASASSSSSSGYTGSGTKSSHGSSGSGGVNRTELMPRYFWYAVAGAVALCVLGRVLGWARVYLRRRARRARAAEKPAPRSAGKLLRVAGAAQAAWDNVCYLRVLPLWVYASTTPAEWVWTLGYIGGTLGLGFWSSYSNGKLDYANPMGIVAFAQIPLITALSARTNVLSLITGVSYEKLNYLHRASARVCVLASWLHTIGWLVKGLGTKHGPHSILFQTGAVSLIGCTIMLLTSFAIARRIMYEAFLITHILMAFVFIIGAYYHWSRLGYWCWAGFVPWALDRVLGFVRIAYIACSWRLFGRGAETQCTVELVDEQVLRITARRTHFKWKAGQHAFITMPSVATLRYEQHPFTMLNVPNEAGEVVFIVRAHGGFTKRLRDKLTSDVSHDLALYLDGPYGEPHSLAHHDAVVLVVGGTGITYGLSHFLALVQAPADAGVRRVVLLWNVRHAAHAAWIAPCVNATLAKAKSHVDAEIRVHVTRSHVADEPSEPAGITGLAAVSPGFESERGPAHDSVPSLGARSASTGLSPSGSSEALDEKADADAEARAIGDAAARCGLDAPARAVVSFHRGRADVGAVLGDAARGTDGTVAVGVCGPTALVLDARRAALAVNSAAAVARGQARVEFYSESFSW